MVKSCPPRRPAMLTPAKAESIVGDENPATSSGLAHSSAWALMGVGDEDFDREATLRLRALVRDRGVDQVAHLWSHSPEFTLPGALWRLYLLLEWYEREPGLVDERYVDGAHADIVPGLEHPLNLPELTDVMADVARLLTGELTDDDLEEVIWNASNAMRVLAAGFGGGGSWITDPNDPLAYPVSTRAEALLKTAEELSVSAREAHIGALE